MFKYSADFNAKTKHGLTALHCAALVPTGLVTIYFLEHNMKNFEINCVEDNGGTPLHYAIMNIEENNIQALLSLGADINNQDNRGDSMLHILLARYINDQENYGVYKEVIKQLL